MGTRLCVPCVLRCGPNRPGWADNQSFFRDFNAPVAVRGFDVQHHFFVHKQFVVQSQVVAIGVQLGFAKRIDLDVRSKRFLISCPDKIMAVGVHRKRISRGCGLDEAQAVTGAKSTLFGGAKVAWATRKKLSTTWRQIVRVPCLGFCQVTLSKWWSREPDRGIMWCCGSSKRE